MSNQSRYFKLGMFVITGVVLIVGGVVLFGASELFTPYVTVQTATTDSVEGLNVGSAVKYEGVEVGKVSKIELAGWSHSDPDPAVQRKIGRYIIIEMKLQSAIFRGEQAKLIEERLRDRVTAGLRVRPASSGLTGPAFIEGVYLDPQANPPQELPWKQETLLIPSAPSAMSAIVSNVQDVLGRIDRVDINKLVGSAQRFLTDTDTAVNDLHTAELRQKALGTVAKLDDSLTRAQKFLTDTDTAVNDLHTAELRQRALATVAKLDDSLTRINEIVRDRKTQQTLDDLNTTLANTSEGSAELRRTLKTLETLLASQSQDLKSIIQELSRTSESAANLLADLQQNPSRALFGQPPPHIEPGAKQK